MEQKNLILAIVASVLILLGSQFLLDSPKVADKAAPQQTVATGTAGAPPISSTSSAPPIPGAPASPASTAGVKTRAEILAATPRVAIRTPRLSGSISTKGGRLDDLVLLDYRETVKPQSPNIVLFSPAGSANPYYTEYGWVSAQASVVLPTADTVWTADKPALTPASPLTLSWDNGQGLRFLRRFAIDENYMVSVTQIVENRSEAAVILYPYGLVSRTGTPETSGFFILHEGPLGVLGGTLKEVDYDDLKDDGDVTSETTGGWIGITDKYWLAALIPAQDHQVKARFAYSLDNDRDKYQVDSLGGPEAIAPGGRAEVSNHLFAGAKEVRLLDRYAEEMGIPFFDKAVDFGWFYFLTKPIFYVLDYLHSHLGNFGISILLLTVMIKALFFPLANKSYRAMSKLKLLQPKMVELREKFGDDRARMNQEMMALYKQEKANPMAGCLPMLVQIPVFFALYKVLFVTIEMRHTPFFGWIRDLSAPDPLTVFNLFGAIPWTPPDFLAIGIWPLIMGLTMFLQQRISPQPADPTQAKVFLLMPVVFTFLLARFPAGLVIYWAWNNTLSIIQQLIIMRRMGVKP